MTDTVCTQTLNFSLGLSNLGTSKTLDSGTPKSVIFPDKAISYCLVYRYIYTMPEPISTSLLDSTIYIYKYHQMNPQFHRIPRFFMSIHQLKQLNHEFFDRRIRLLDAETVGEPR